MKPFKLILTALIIIFTLSSCTNSESTFVVKSGKHFSSHSIKILDADTIAFKVKTNETWIWKKPAKNGWSKVTGIAWNSNHKNSVRLVYMRINDSTGVLGYYYYAKGISPQQNNAQKGILDTISIPATYNCSLGYNEGYYFVRVNDKVNKFRVKNLFAGGIHKVKTLQYPYIGGTYTIDHDWIVKLKYNF